MFFNNLSDVSAFKDLVLEYCGVYTANAVNISIFDALWIGYGAVVVVLAMYEMGRGEVLLSCVIRQNFFDVN